jgi:hypothetical protein
MLGPAAGYSAAVAGGALALLVGTLVNATHLAALLRNAGAGGRQAGTLNRDSHG